MTSRNKELQTAIISPYRALQDKSRFVPFPNLSYTTPFREGFGDTCKVGLLALDRQRSFLSSPLYRVTCIEKRFTITVAGPLGTCTDSLLPLALCKSTLLLSYCPHHTIGQEKCPRFSKLSYTLYLDKNEKGPHPQMDQNL